MMSEKYRTISIKPETYNELLKEGKNLQDTFDIVINRLIKTSRSGAVIASSSHSSFDSGSGSRKEESSL